MENKEIKIDVGAFEEESVQSVSADDTQEDSLSGIPVPSDDIQKEAESIEEDFSLSELSEYLQDDNFVDEMPDEEAEEKKQGTVLSYLHDLVFGLVAILLVFMLLFRGVVVSGPSMQNTLVDGDYIILLSNVLYQNPRPGDIIVASKNSFRDGEPIIKRVIATEGQKVDIDFVTGIVYVNDVPLDDSYTKTPTNLYEGIDFPLIVDEGCVFVMGDNRNDSTDSRSPRIGLIDKREIMGKAIFLVLPGRNVDTDKRDFDRIGVLW